MRTDQGTTLQSLRAVKGFLDQHDADLPGLRQTGTFTRLEEVIATLGAHVCNQTASHLDAEGLTQRRRELETVLRRDHMTIIVRIAKTDLPNTPEFRALRMPRGKPTPEKLAAAASGMAQVAARFSDTFIAAGLPVDFVDRLNAAADAMLDTLASRTLSQGKRRGATSGLKEKLSEGRKVVGILDAFVQTALHAKPSLLEDWNLVMRVPKTATRTSAADRTEIPSAPPVIAESDARTEPTVTLRIEPASDAPGSSRSAA